MLNLVSLHGSQLAIAYSLLHFAEYVPSKKGDVVTLHFASHTVKLLGRRLDAIYQVIREQRVASILAVDPLRAPAGDGPLVTDIQQVPRASSSE